MLGLDDIASRIHSRRQAAIGKIPTLKGAKNLPIWEAARLEGRFERMMQLFRNLFAAPPKVRRLVGGGVIACIWLALLGASGWLMLRREYGAGESQVAPSSMPPTLQRWRQTDRPLLVMAVHPECRCTTASLDVLSRLVARFGDRMEVLVLAQSFGDRGGGGSPGVNLRTAAGIPGVRIIADPKGHWAKELGEQTSGDVVLYGTDGALRFHGGLTASRGFYMPGTGFESLEQLLQDSMARAKVAPVFGCPLQPRPST